MFNNHHTDKEQDQLVKDMQELCNCCAKGIVMLSERYHINPQVLTKTFIEVFQNIVEEMNKS